jgi:hypothetical protein
MRRHDERSGRGIGAAAHATAEEKGRTEEEKDRMDRQSGRWRARATGLAAVVLAGGVAAACSDILAVDTPGQVAAGDLDPPTVAQLMVISAISDFECAWNQYTAGASTHADEYVASSGNLALRDWGMRRMRSDDPNFAQGTCGAAVFPA